MRGSLIARVMQVYLALTRLNVEWGSGLNGSLEKLFRSLSLAGMWITWSSCARKQDPVGRASQHCFFLLSAVLAQQMPSLSGAGRVFRSHSSRREGWIPACCLAASTAAFVSTELFCCFVPSCVALQGERGAALLVAALPWWCWAASEELRASALGCCWCPEWRLVSRGRP